MLWIILCFVYFVCNIVCFNWVVLGKCSELCVVLLQLACNDSEVYEEASHCVSLLAQLYGGEGADRLQPEELLSLAHALQEHTEPRQQKLLLRVLKRLVSACKCWSETSTYLNCILWMQYEQLIICCSKSRLHSCCIECGGKWETRSDFKCDVKFLNHF